MKAIEKKKILCLNPNFVIFIMNGFDSGTYTTPHGKKYVSAFLGLQKMETEKQINNGEKQRLFFWMLSHPLASCISKKYFNNYIF